MLEVYSFDGARSGHPAITLDKFGRLYLNAEMREKLGIVPGQPFKCHVAYDTDNGDIGLARPGTVNVSDTVSPCTFDRKRYYANVRGFLNRYGIDHSQSHRYIYVELKNNWHMFRREDKIKP